MHYCISVPRSIILKSSRQPFRSYLHTGLLQHRIKQNTVLWPPECRSISVGAGRDFTNIFCEMCINIRNLFFWKKGPLCFLKQNITAIRKAPLQPELYYSALGLLQQRNKTELQGMKHVFGEKHSEKSIWRQTVFRNPESRGGHFVLFFFLPPFI